MLRRERENRCDVDKGALASREVTDIPLRSRSRHLVMSAVGSPLTGGFLRFDSALGVEAARCPTPLRTTFIRAIWREIDRFAAAFPGTAAERRRKATASFVAMVGPWCLRAS